MNIKGFCLAATVALAFLLMSQSSFAAGAVKQVGPHEVVQGITDGMMQVIRGEGELYKKDPKRYFANIQKKLEPSVGFRYIAKNVMGKYGKAATPKQREKFTKVFTGSLVETLGKGMSTYSDLKVSTLPFDSSKGDLSVLRKVEVVQQIEAIDGTTKVSYTMAKNKSGQWKMINVVLNGINLGKQFRNQFTQSMKQNDNDIDKVISLWTKPA